MYAEVHFSYSIVLTLAILIFYYALPQHAVEALWLTIKDLLDESNSAEVRQLALEFITVLVSGQVCKQTGLNCRYIIKQ